MARRMMLAGVLAWLPSLAQADFPWPWDFYSRPGGAGYVSNCRPSDIANEPCVTFICGDTAGDYLRIYASARGMPGGSQVMLRLDGQDTLPASVLREDMGDMGDVCDLFMARETFLALIERVARSQQMALVFHMPMMNLPEFRATALTTVAQHLANLAAHCATVPAYAPAAVPAVLAAPPAGDPARYVAVASVAQQGPQVVALAMQLEQGRIGRHVQLDPLLIPFSDGRQALIVNYCVPANPAPSGCSTDIFVAPAAGAAFELRVDRMWRSPPFYLDLQSTTAGLPDLVAESDDPAGLTVWVRSALTGP